MYTRRILQWVLVILLVVTFIIPSQIKAQDSSVILSTPSASPIPAPLSGLSQNEEILREGLNENQIGSLSLLNPLQHVIRTAVDRGISANMIVFLLLFPVIASLVAFSRHVIGLSGFSIYAPAALAVVLLSTGVFPGILLFACMLLVASVGKKLIELLHLEYVPRTAMLLLFVAFGVFLTVFLSTWIPGILFQRFDVFPLLILVLLSEDFIGIQSELLLRQALSRSFQIMVLAVGSTLIMGSLEVQRFALQFPELIVFAVAVFNFAVGKYLGLRLTEYLRFRPIIDAEE
jgi:hypothetical protein